MGLGDEGLLALHKGLQDGRVERLDLRANAITDEGVAALMEQRAPPRLQTLALGENAITAPSQQRLEAWALSQGVALLFDGFE